jgi:hypothetical protein
MFNSPLNYCPVCRQYVALDQSQRECAREHDCSPAEPCPLAHLFTVHAPGTVPEGSGDAPASMTQTGTPAPER